MKLKIKILIIFQFLLTSNVFASPLSEAIEAFAKENNLKIETISGDYQFSKITIDNYLKLILTLKKVPRFTLKLTDNYADPNNTYKVLIHPSENTSGAIFSAFLDAQEKLFSGVRISRINLRSNDMSIGGKADSRKSLDNYFELIRKLQLSNFPVMEFVKRLNEEFAFDIHVDPENQKNPLLPNAQ